MGNQTAVFIMASFLFLHLQAWASVSCDRAILKAAQEALAKPAAARPAVEAPSAAPPANTTISAVPLSTSEAPQALVEKVSKEGFQPSEIAEAFKRVCK